MNLRELLDRCTDAHSDDWVRLPGERPATSMLAGIHDPGGDVAQTRPLTGHTIAVYEPDPRLSMVWPVPDEDSVSARSRRWESELPAWAGEGDTSEWNSADPNWVVVLWNGSPVWQARVWYLDWGAGTGGYVADFQPVFKKLEGGPNAGIVGYETTKWAIGNAGLLNTFSASGEFAQFDLTPRVCPSPDDLHPVDAERLQE